MNRQNDADVAEAVVAAVAAAASTAECCRINERRHRPRRRRYRTSVPGLLALLFRMRLADLSGRTNEKTFP